MLASTFLHNQLKKSSSVHAKQLNSLFLAVDAAYKTSCLSLTSLGRKISNNAQTNSNITRMDRLLGNTKLHQNREQIYSVINDLFFRQCQKPNISVDWSSFVHGDKFAILRATLSLKGRSFTVYEQTYDLKDYNKPKTHRAFLFTLKSVLPQECKPIITTDAGFGITWFKEVSRLGWDFVGRLRNNTQYKKTKGGVWKECLNLYKESTNTPQHLGKVILSKTHEYHCYLSLVKHIKKGRAKRNLRGEPMKTSGSKKNARRARDPWLIVTSIAEQDANQIINLYKKRMQIEESFRDTKSTKYGFGLNASRSRSKQRIDILLLITSLASALAWLVGLAAQRLEVATKYQAQRIRKLVLSVVFVGRQILADGELIFKPKEYIKSIQEICHIAHEASL